MSNETVKKLINEQVKLLSERIKMLSSDDDGPESAGSGVPVTPSGPQPSSGEMAAPMEEVGTKGSFPLIQKGQPVNL